ncbi:Leucine-rich repeat protein kinase family protein, partial [Prunus dulcis]
KFPQKNIRQKIPSSSPPLFLPAKQIGVKDHAPGVLAKGTPMPKLGRGEREAEKTKESLANILLGEIYSHSHGITFETRIWF